VWGAILFSRKRTCSPFEEFPERISTIEDVPRSFLRRKDLVRIDLEGSTDWGDEIPSLFFWKVQISDFMRFGDRGVPMVGWRARGKGFDQGTNRCALGRY
jgi:hypothetical protein